jgi:hypothetical protein
MYGSASNNPSCGVIDHCRLVNSYGLGGVFIYMETVAYGVANYGYGAGQKQYDLWQDDPLFYLGKYTPVSVFMEDNYFSNWRHCISSNTGAHWVFRHNLVEHDRITTLDAHGSYGMTGTRATETYDNIFIDGTDYLFGWRGGDGVYFDNISDASYRIIMIGMEGANVWPKEVPKYAYLWAGKGNLPPVITNPGPPAVINIGVEAPGYQKYRYPHHLVDNTSPLPLLAVQANIRIPFMIRKGGT